MAAVLKVEPSSPPSDARSIVKTSSDADPRCEKTPTDSDSKRPTKTPDNLDGTTGDNGVNAALARALDLATANGRLDLVERILAQVERRRG